jgi:hypothetical protein
MTLQIVAIRSLIVNCKCHGSNQNQYILAQELGRFIALNGPSCSNVSAKRNY